MRVFNKTIIISLALSLGGLTLACGGKDNVGALPTPTPDGVPELLSEHGFFTGDGSTQEPVDGVIPYEPIAPLFSDYAVKLRFLYVPDGEVIGYQNDAKWDYPAGTTLIKTFAYPEDFQDPNSPLRLMETRLLIKQEDTALETWTVHTYVWNDEQTEATRTKVGTRIPVTFIDAGGNSVDLDYRVPNNNQCLGCHGDHGITNTLGPRTRQLNWDYDYGSGPENQIDHLDGLGLFDTSPPPFPQRPSLVDPFDTNADIELRARSYLDTNCAHCHNQNAGFAVSSGLYLGAEITDPSTYGVCRTPSAAGGGSGGLTYDIVPGDADSSIIVFRMESTDPDERMPEMPNQLTHPEGVQVVRDWINQITPAGCP